MKTKLLALALLAGCTSYAERQAHPPNFQAASSKTPDDYISCAAPKIITARGIARVIPDGASRVVLIGNEYTTGLTLTASPNGSGSAVALRIQIANAFPEAWPLAQSCL